MREKSFVEYPLCLSFGMAKAWMEAGHELWQEDSNDFPNACGFDDFDCFEDCFSDKEIDWTYGIHLVPFVPETTTKKGLCNDMCVDFGKQITDEQIKATEEHLTKYNIKK